MAVPKDQDDPLAVLAELRAIARRFGPTFRQAGMRDIDAEDIAQQAFLKIASFRGPIDDPSAYRKKVVANEVFGLLRTKTRQAQVDLLLPSDSGEHTGPIDLWDTLQSPDPTPEALAIRSERRNALERAISELPPMYRKVVEMQGAYLSNKEIAAVLGTTETTIRVRLCRAIEQMRLKLRSPCSAPHGQQQEPIK